MQKGSVSLTDANTLRSHSSLMICPDTWLASQSVSGGVRLQIAAKIPGRDEEMNHICPASDITYHVETMTTIRSCSSLFPIYSSLKRSFSGHRKITSHHQFMFLLPPSDTCKFFKTLNMILRLNVVASWPHIFSPFTVMQEVPHAHKQTQIIQLACVIHIFTVQLCSGAVALFALWFSFSLCGRDGFVPSIMNHQPVLKPSSRSVSPVRGLNTLRSPQSP